MKGYWIARVTVTDPDQYKLYAESAPEAFRKYGAKVLARGGRCAADGRRGPAAQCRDRVRQLR